MLKIIFIDLVPYIVDDKVIFNQTWKQVLNTQYNDLLNQHADFQELFKKDFLNPDVQNEFKQLLGDEQKFQMLSREFIRNVVDVENRYFNAFELAAPIKKLIEDCKNNDCNLIIISSHNEYLEKIKWALNFKHVDFLIISENEMITADNLCTFTSNKNTCVHEFLCITQNEKTINDLITKDFFCATINKIKNIKGINPYVFSSFQDLDFETLQYNFIEVISDESEDL